ncbi:hypothetical protein FOWG_16932 [Fusarium oxysporum f. sp. lycopersici MN25]|nr:hypothetical protein FOWG_16932 [Fusarium oxysporum f. sp. lycopersici MN25]
MTSQVTAPTLMRTTTHRYRICGNGCRQPGLDSTCSGCDTEIPVLIYAFSNRLSGYPCYGEPFYPTAPNLFGLAKIDYEGSYRSLLQQSEDGTSSGSHSCCTVINIRFSGYIISIIIQVYEMQGFTSESNNQEKRLLKYVGIVLKVLIGRGHEIIPTGPHPNIATTRNLDEIEPIHRESPALPPQHYIDAISEEIGKRLEEDNKSQKRELAEGLSHSSTSEECCICYEEDDIDMLSLPCCNQPICDECIKQVLEGHTRCPMCRKFVMRWEMVDALAQYNIVCCSFRP